MVPFTTSSADSRPEGDLGVLVLLPPLLWCKSRPDPSHSGPGGYTDGSERRGSGEEWNGDEEGRREIQEGTDGVVQSEHP